LAARVPGLREAWQHAIWQPDCADIDVAGLHQHYLARAARSGVQLHRRFRVARAERQVDHWRLTAKDGGVVEAACIVNAAGAWADHLAQLAGVSPKTIQPLRRTVAQLRVSPAAPADLPLVLDINGGFYFKPDAGRLWLSPHDETPCDPCDSAPEEYDIALAIDRLARIVDWHVERVEHSWAGLRSFAPDRLPVYGFADERRDFFWCAGQGGFGIQTAPAAAKLAAALLLGIEPDPMVSGIDPAPYLASRFMN